MEVVFSFILDYIFLDHELDPLSMFGAALICSSSLLLQSDKKKEENNEDE
jgi:drug/metabolite transporter (DMT)-like permease